MAADTLPSEYLDNYRPLLLPPQELLLRSPHPSHLSHPSHLPQPPTNSQSRKGPRVTFQDPSSSPLKSPLCSRHTERQPAGEEWAALKNLSLLLLDISLQRKLSMDLSPVAVWMWQTKCLSSLLKMLNLKCNCCSVDDSPLVVQCLYFNWRLF